MHDLDTRAGKLAAKSVPGSARCDAGNVEAMQRYMWLSHEGAGAPGARSKH